MGELAEEGGAQGVRETAEQQSGESRDRHHEDRIREICLPMGLVDVKVCAVDETWSGLKLMKRRSR
jgi:hypothetical protein